MFERYHNRKARIAPRLLASLSIAVVVTLGMVSYFATTNRSTDASELGDDDSTTLRQISATGANSFGDGFFQTSSPSPTNSTNPSSSPSATESPSAGPTEAPSSNPDSSQSPTATPSASGTGGGTTSSGSTGSGVSGSTGQTSGQGTGSATGSTSGTSGSTSSSTSATRPGSSSPSGSTTSQTGRLSPSVGSNATTTSSNELGSHEAGTAVSAADFAGLTGQEIQDKVIAHLPSRELQKVANRPTGQLVAHHFVKAYQEGRISADDLQRAVTGAYTALHAVPPPPACINGIPCAFRWAGYAWQRLGKTY